VPGDEDEAAVGPTVTRRGSFVVLPLPVFTKRRDHDVRVTALFEVARRSAGGGGALISLD
jgi:hypothetical protein